MGMALALGVESVDGLEGKFPLQMKEVAPQGARTVFELAWLWGDGFGHTFVDEGVLEVAWVGAAKKVVDC